MRVIDNQHTFLKDDLAQTIKPHARLSIAAASFSMYAFAELKEQLEQIDSLRFIFTEPTFTADKPKKEKREFYIPRLNRERSVCGSDFEVKLRNELTLKAISKECADWIRQKVQFKSNTNEQTMQGFIEVENPSKEYSSVYSPVADFTTVELGNGRGKNLFSITTQLDYPMTEGFLAAFNSLWSDKDQLQNVTDEVLETISTAYSENSPDVIYFVTLYNIFSEFLDDVSEDVLPNEATGFKNSAIWNMLYDFQKDAALAIINKLEKYNGCILADSVGLGKTFTALGVIKYYESRNKSVLVLCPKKLASNWNTYKENYVNNPIAKDRLNYTVLFHTDLSRKHGESNGVDLGRINWANYDLIVIDESHNFRNGGDTASKVQGDENDEKENRYLRLMNKVIKQGVKKKVLMLSATPVNNRFNDLKNQLALAYEGDSEELNEKLAVSRPLEEIFRNAQKAFNEWSKLPAEQRLTQNLLSKLDFDFFEVLDSVTIARSRKHIEKYYDINAIGAFPERLKPISLRPPLTDISDAITYNGIYAELMKLNLAIYIPTTYVFPSKVAKYVDVETLDEYGLSLAGREMGIRKLMAINLLKRLESSVHSFRLTLSRIDSLITNTISAIDRYETNRTDSTVAVTDAAITGSAEDFDDDDLNTDYFISGKKMKIDLADMDYKSWRIQLEADRTVLDNLIKSVAVITPEHDSKLQELRRIVADKIQNPLNAGNRKVLLFTAFADTAEYLYSNIGPVLKEKHGLNTGLVTGSIENKTTVKDFRCDMNTLLTCFSPLSKEKKLLMPDDTNSIDVLIATDCISEGQNLQDCDYLVNYDIHWNPVRIIQRFGRIDRIGSRNSFIQMVNFWPDLTLDEYINLKVRVETRMKISVMTSTGDDDPINEEEKGDLAYRKEQLKKLQEEVCDMEDMGSGISIMDLGLNEFRLDLLDYMKTNKDITHAHNGMHAVVSCRDNLPGGVIYVLKNLNGGVNINSRNRLHPFYMVYITEDGTVYCNHLDPKHLLDTMRFLCRGKTEPEKDVVSSFNKETRDGRSMKKYSDLLGKAIESIITVKETSDIDSLFTPGGTSALTAKIRGLDDFELIDFVVIRGKEK
jgi:SNF2 family DNA or RNA helicase